MIITRERVLKLFGSVITTLTVHNDKALFMSSLDENPSSEKPTLPSQIMNPTVEYHEPPKGLDYDSNPTVFGRILDGTLPCRVIDETDELLTFHDRTPRAPLHALVIPKRFIPSIIDLDPTAAEGRDLDLVLDMKRIALQTIQMEHPLAYEKDDFKLCFHVPPFISVPHLHLHVLAPASEMQWQYRNLKYLEGTRWCMGVDQVIELLEDGEYIRPGIC